MYATVPAHIRETHLKDWRTMFTLFGSCRTLAAAAVTMLLFVAPRTVAQSPDSEDRPVSELETRLINVHGSRKLLDGGSSIDWSQTTNRMLIGKRGVNQYFNVYYVSPVRPRPRVVTLNRDPDNPRLHNGNPSWMPGDKYFLFTGQNRGSSSYRMSLPDSGLNCNIWLADREGETFWKLTNLPTRYTDPRGVVSPDFSPDRSKVVWSGNTGDYPRESVWGRHAVYLADFEMEGGKPKLTNQQTLQPGPRPDFYRSHGFSPDGNKLLFSSNLQERQRVAGMDLYTLDMRTQELTNLTRSADSWDQFGSYSPDGNKIVWMSSRGQKISYLPMANQSWKRHLKTELWIMDADGKNARQLTRFNEKGHPDYIGTRAYITESEWGPDGSSIAICLNYETLNFNLESRIVVLKLGKGPRPENAELMTPPVRTVRTRRENLPDQSWRFRRLNR